MPFPAPADSERLVGKFYLVALLCLLPRLDAGLGNGAAVLKSVRLIACFHNMTVMGQPIQQSRRHLGINEYTRPFGETQVRCDYVELR